MVFSQISKYLQQEITTERIAQLKRFVPKDDTILEVGPGGGEIIGSLLSAGYKIEAVEQSKELAAYLSKQYNILIKTDEFEKQAFKKVYDAYMSFHVIEHVSDVDLHFRKINRIVKPGGYIFLATPNADSWLHKLPTKFSYHYDSAHLQLFSKKSLSLLSKEYGWEIIQLSTPEYSIVWLRFITRLLRIVKGTQNNTEGGEYINSFSPKKKILLKLFAIFSSPFRFIISRLRLGNELFIIAKKINENKDE